MWVKSSKGPYTIYEKHTGDMENTELIVGTVNEKNIDFVGVRYGPRDQRRVNQYWFENDQPAGYHYSFITSPQWPADRPPMDPEFRHHFEMLGEQYPQVKGSLMACILLLEQPGPSYQGNE